MRYDLEKPGPALSIVFEQSRSPKGVAASMMRWSPELVRDESYVSHLTKYTVDNIRAQAIEAHGADPMPPDDGTYRLEPWPPEQDPILTHVWRTVLLYGDGKTNLRPAAAERLREAERNGATIKVPIRPPDPNYGKFDMSFVTRGPGDIGADVRELHDLITKRTD